MKDKIIVQTYQTYDYIFRHAAADFIMIGHANWNILPYDPSNYKPPTKAGILHITYSEGNTHSVYRLNEAVVSLSINKRGVNVSVGANTKVRIEQIVKSLKRQFSPIESPDDGLVDVKFHFLTNTGPQEIERRIEVPSWDDIQGNYEASTRRELNKLFSDFKPAHGGQLILFQGEPGTGKSFVLRALCSSWKNWCTVDYIVDPDAFFGAGSYLMSLLSTTEEYYDDETDDIVHVEEGGWKLFILEDTGELLSEDAKDRTGQGLARLLNVVDGFIGQGLKILILITSNEDLGKLHPAVSRPGRCAAVIKFNELTARESETWAEARGINLPVYNKSYTLAELFSIADEFENRGAREISAPLGFRMAT